LLNGKLIKELKSYVMQAIVSPTKARRLAGTLAIDIISLTAEQKMELTIPATYVLDRDRTILHVSFNTSGHNSDSVNEMLDYLV